MSNNPYIKAQRDKFDALTANVRSITDKAAAEKRDLTEDEVRSVTEQNDSARALAETIKSLTEAETRAAEVGAIAAKTENDEEVRTSRVTTQDRDPGHYRKNGGEFSYFGDQFRAQKMGDGAAAQRLADNTRALSSGTNGPGVLPPKWMTDEFETLKRQGRALANVVRNETINDARPITLPKQTAGTDAVVGVQASENTAPTSTDAWDSDVETLTPVTITGAQLVSRQLLDGSSPAVDNLIFGDLISVYNAQVEARVGAALITAAGTPAALATEAAFIADKGDAIIDASVAVRVNRHAPAEIVAMTPQRYGAYLKLKDTTGRPLIPLETAGPMNVIGTGSVAVDGRIHGLGVIATEGLGTGAYPDKFLVLRPADTILFESGMLQFRYDEVNGPQSIKLGIWAYAGVIVREGGRGVKAIQVTAAS
ncbi:phage major capsid protein [Amycolatopsis japonica]|uniref:phage major capsid protein n=1 Tax=Amycolatopsis japonica TaxID=208439 RepID=UPI0037A62EE7